MPSLDTILTLVVLLSVSRGITGQTGITRPGVSSRRTEPTGNIPELTSMFPTLTPHITGIGSETTSELPNTTSESPNTTSESADNVTMSSDAFQARSGIVEADGSSGFGDKLESENPSSTQSVLPSLYLRDQPHDLVPFEDLESSTDYFRRRNQQPTISPSQPEGWSPINWPSNIPSPISIDIDEHTAVPKFGSDQSIPSVFHFSEPSTTAGPVEKIPISQYFFDITDAGVPFSKIPGPLHDINSATPTIRPVDTTRAPTLSTQQNVQVTTPISTLRSSLVDVSNIQSASTTENTASTPSLSESIRVDPGEISASAFIPTALPTAIHSTDSKTLSTGVNNHISTDGSVDILESVDERDPVASVLTPTLQPSQPQYSLGTDSDLYLPRDQESPLETEIAGDSLVPSLAASSSFDTTATLSPSSTVSRLLHTSRPNLIPHNKKASTGETRKPLWKLLNDKTNSSELVSSTSPSTDANDFPVGILSNEVPMSPSSVNSITSTVPNSISPTSTIPISISPTSTVPTVESTVLPDSLTSLPTLSSSSTTEPTTILNTVTPVLRVINASLSDDDTVGNDTDVIESSTVEATSVQPEYSGGFTPVIDLNSSVVLDSTSTTLNESTTVPSPQNKTTNTFVLEGGFAPIAPQNILNNTSTSTISSTPKNSSDLSDDELDTSMLLKTPTFIVPDETEFGTTSYQTDEFGTSTTFGNDFRFRLTQTPRPITTPRSTSSVVLGITPKSTGTVGFDQSKTSVFNNTGFSTKPSNQTDFSRKPTTYVYPHELLVNASDVSTPFAQEVTTSNPFVYYDTEDDDDVAVTGVAPEDSDPTTQTPDQDEDVETTFKYFDDSNPDTTTSSTSLLPEETTTATAQTTTSQATETPIPVLVEVENTTTTALPPVETTTTVVTKSTEIDKPTTAASTTENYQTTTSSTTELPETTTEAVFATTGQPTLTTLVSLDNGTDVSHDVPYIKALIGTSQAEFCVDKQKYRELLLTWLEGDRDDSNTSISFFSTPDCSSPPPSHPHNTTSVFFYVSTSGEMNSNLTRHYPLFPKLGGDLPQELKQLKVLQLELVQPTVSPLGTDNTPTEAGGGMGVASIAAIVVTALLVALSVTAAIILVMYRRSRSKANNYGKRCTPVSMDAYSVDSVSVYHSFRRKNKRNRSSRSVKSYLNQGFEDPDGPTRPVDFAQLTHFISDMDGVHEEFSTIPVVNPDYDEMPHGTQDRNRYANVIPVSETRVLLQVPRDNPEQQYINANYVKGPHSEPNYYIATQAPLESTVSDFWRMVWEQECKVIAMLTNFVEQGIDKCADYLPPSQTLDCHRVYGDFQVTLKTQDMQETFITSNVVLKNLETSLTRDVCHLWFTGWPPRGVPNTEKPFISYVLATKRARKQMRSKGPMVVHCSPGTGRTGTFIAVDQSIKQFEDNRLVNIPRTVYGVRRERAGAVQTSEQYAFIYRTVNLFASKLSSGNLDSL